MQVRRILETCLYTDNLNAAATFYGQVLGLELYSRVEGRHVLFRCGESMLLLFNAEATRRATGEVPTHGTDGAGHVAFAMAPQDVAAWRSHVESENVAIEAEIAWPGGGHSRYFRDPAGNSVELATLMTWRLPEEEQPAK